VIPDPFPDPGQNQIIQRQKKKKYDILQVLKQKFSPLLI